MAISKVWIEEGCTACGTCEELCPDVFVLNDIAEIKEGADLNSNEECIVESAETCPEEVIQYK